MPDAIRLSMIDEAERHLKATKRQIRRNRAWSWLAFGALAWSTFFGVIAALSDEYAIVALHAASLAIWWFLVYRPRHQHSDTLRSAAEGLTVLIDWARCPHHGPYCRGAACCCVDCHLKGDE